MSPAVAERERLGHRGDAQPRRPAVARRAADLDDAVAVAVGLDDGHHRGGGRPGRPASGRCAGPRPGRPRSPGAWAPVFRAAFQRARARPRGSPARRRGRSADRPARRTSPRRRAATNPPRPRRTARAPPPAARRSARRGRRPRPAVASHGTPVVVIRTGPSGRATTVRRPLSSTTASYRAAASRAWRSGAASIPPRGSPVIRDSSPACGVSTAGTVSGPSTQRQRVGVDHDRDAVQLSLGEHRRDVGPPPEPIVHACTRPFSTTTSGWAAITSSRAPAT